MSSGQGIRVAKGSRCDVKWVYHQENTSQEILKIYLNNGVVLHLVGRYLWSYLLSFSSPVSCERQRVDFLGDFSRRTRKFQIFSEIMTDRCRPLWPLWASATLPFSRNLAIKFWIALPSGTLVLSKSFLHCRCVRRTDFVVKHSSIILICYCVV